MQIDYVIREKRTISTLHDAEREITATISVDGDYGDGQVTPEMIGEHTDKMRLAMSADQDAWEEEMRNRHELDNHRQAVRGIINYIGQNGQNEGLMVRYNQALGYLPENERTMYAEHMEVALKLHEWAKDHPDADRDSDEGGTLFRRH